MFVLCRIAEHFVPMLVDTGSSKSLISKDFYDSLDMTNVTSEKTNTKLLTANSTEINVFGEVMLPLTIGSKEYTQHFIVADIKEFKGIIGMNFLGSHQGKVDIDKKTLKLGKSKVWLKSNPTAGITRVKLVENVSIPPCSEMLVSCAVDRPCFLEEGLVEPVKFLKGRKLLLAKSLVNPQCKIVLSFINMGEKPVNLKSDTIVGKIYPVEKVCLATHENMFDENFEVPDHLKPLIENASENLTESERGELKNLIVEFGDIFKEPEGPLGQTDLVLHEIDTGGEKPVKLPPRRLPQKQKEIIDKELDKMLKDNIIEPSDSPWSSHICLVTKKDGSLRFCVDFRKLNQITRKDAYPLPRIDDTLDTLTNSKWFSTLDLASGYWQIRMHPRDKPKTAFATHRGLFQFNVLPFGLSNGPSSLRRLMERVLGHLSWHKCL